MTPLKPVGNLPLFFEMVTFSILLHGTTHMRVLATAISDTHTAFAPDYFRFLSDVLGQGIFVK